MDINIQKRIPVRQIQTTKRNIPLEQIIAVNGFNPLAAGIDTSANAIGSTITKRAELRRQGQQIAQLAAMTGESTTDTNSLTPDIYEKGLALKTAREDKKSQAAKERVALELQLEKLKGGYVESDPSTGKVTKYPGVKGLSIEYDPTGNPFIKRAENYQPSETPKSSGSGASVGKKRLVGVSDSGAAISYNPSTQRNELPDGSEYVGTILPSTLGSAEQRSKSLVSTGKQAIQSVRQNLTPEVLTELKAIRLTPGRVYSQLASSEAKEVYTNLRRAMENEVYLRTGATANPSELENSVVANMAALNDNPQDFLSRMNLLDQSISGFNQRKLSTLDIPKPRALPTNEPKKATHRWNSETGRVEAL